MKKSAWRLALSAALFAAWIGYLAYLAATTTQPIVLSRPQFLMADLYLVAELVGSNSGNDKPANEVSVKEVIWRLHAADATMPKVVVKNLNLVDEKHGWQGPGEYILALSRSKEDSSVFEVTALPRTPGFAGESGRIYPATPKTQRQLELLAKEYHP